MSWHRCSQGDDFRDSDSIPSATTVRPSERASWITARGTAWVRSFARNPAMKDPRPRSAVDRAILRALLAHNEHQPGASTNLAARYQRFANA
jgi:hypothetical protein